MKKQKKLLAVISIIIILTINTLPIIAANVSGIGLINIYDGQVSSQIELSITQNYNILQIRYDTSDSMLYIEIGQMDQLDIIYSMYFSNKTYADIQLEINNNIVFGQINPSYELYSVSAGAGASPDEYGFTINITIYGGNKEYSQDELNQYGNSQYDLGQQSILSNPSAYGLYTEQQKNEYGQREYERGQKSGIITGASLTEAEAYNLGLEQGHKDSATLKGVANVFLSNIYNTFVNITSKSGIFGTTLISILITGVIVLIVYFIFKLERS